MKAVLETPNPTGKHARWWSKVYGCGVREVRIVYRAGKENKNADALSRSPVSPAPQTDIAEDEVQVESVCIIPEDRFGSNTGPHFSGNSCESELAAEDEVLGIDLQNLFEYSDSDKEGVGVLPPTSSNSSPSPQPFDGEPPVECHYLTSPDDNPNSSREEREENSHSQNSFAMEQRKDKELREILDYLECGALPDDDSRARKIVLQGSQFAVIDEILYFIDPKQKNQRRVAVPEHLRQQIMREVHSSPYSGHFSGQRLYNTLATRWWWEGTFSDAKKFVKSCPECAIVMGSGRVNKPPLHPIPVSRPFQILGIDVMDLPVTDQGNKHVVVIQDMFSKWPMVFAVPDQKTTHISRLIAEEVISLFGVPESLPRDEAVPVRD